MSIQPLKPAQRPHSIGIGAVLGYDPYFERMTHGLKKTLVDGHPIMIRLHAAGAYALPTAEAGRLDLESHAVLIVGFDDRLKAFALLDPAAQGRGAPRITWMDYERLRLCIVNSSLDCFLIMAPLDCSITVRDANAADAGRTLSARIGFYQPDAIVMDRDSQAIRSVRVELIADDDDSVLAVAQQEGYWTLGKSAEINLPAPAHISRLRLSVDATVVMSRPYECTDTIRYTRKLVLTAVEEHRNNRLVANGS